MKLYNIDTAIYISSVVSSIGKATTMCIFPPSYIQLMNNGGMSTFIDLLWLSLCFLFFLSKIVSPKKE